MLYYIHHPGGPVVIRTDNPYIVQHHQNLGWLTTTSFEEVLQDHPEWQQKAPQTTASPSNSLVERFGAAVLGAMSATLAIISSYTPSGTSTTAPLLTPNSSPRAHEGENEQPPTEPAANSLPIHWKTALTRDYYNVKKTIHTPNGNIARGWIPCELGPYPFSYRLASGIIDLPPDAPNPGDTEPPRTPAPLLRIQAQLNEEGLDEATREQLKTKCREIYEKYRERDGVCLTCGDPKCKAFK
jgi:hypothetical protein